MINCLSVDISAHVLFLASEILGLMSYSVNKGESLYCAFYLILIFLFYRIESLRSALLESESASKTERSKSYDEGLENYQEDGRG